MLICNRTTKFIGLCLFFALLGLHTPAPSNALWDAVSVNYELRIKFNYELRIKNYD
jgi:hypothetical protein